MESNDRALAAFAGELLALAGAWEPSTIALKPICTSQATPFPGTPPTHTYGSSSNDKGDDSALVTMIVAGLRLMADYLVDPDVLVIKSTQFTLRRLLATPGGRTALEQLDLVTQSHLQVRQPAQTFSPHLDASEGLRLPTKGLAQECKLLSITAWPQML